MLGNSRREWGAPHKMLHWLMALLVVAQLLIGAWRNFLEGDDARALMMDLHINIGVTVLVLAALRLVWRLSNPVPALPDTLSAGEKKLARGTHWALYGFLFGLPVLGILTANAGEYSALVWGLFELPRFIGPDDRAKQVFNILHVLAAGALIAVVALHAAGAWRHEHRLRDNVLRRMVPFMRMRP